MPADVVLKAMNLVHRSILTVSRGRLGWDFGSMTVLELTTVGRKSGESRSVMLTSPVQQGESLVIVASRGGDDRHPAWFLNLQANPGVQVKTRGGTIRPMRARVATADERVELWPLVTAKYQNYAGYQAKTDRQIPLVLLDPV